MAAKHYTTTPTTDLIIATEIISSAAIRSLKTHASWLCKGNSSGKWHKRFGR